MIDNNSLNDEKRKKDSRLFSAPLWYYRLSAKGDESDFRVISYIILSLIPTLSLLCLIYYIIYYFTPYILGSLITGILLFVFWIFFMRLFWIKFGKKLGLTSFEKFAHNSKAISLILDRLSIDSNISGVETNDSITYLAKNSKKIAEVDKSLDNKTKEKLCEFSKKLDNIFVMLKEPENHRNRITKLSTELSALADNAYFNHKIELKDLDSAISSLSIKRPGKLSILFNFISSIWSFFKKSYYLKGTLFILFDFGIFFGIFLGSQKYLEIERNTAFYGAIVFSVGILAIIYKSLKK